MKNLKRTILGGILVLPLLLVLSASAQKGKVQSVFNVNGIKSMNLGDFTEKRDILYMISNNDENLYIEIVVPGEIEQKKILIFGLTTWVDLKVKSKKDIGIMFPYRMSDKNAKAPGQISGGAGTAGPGTAGPGTAGPGAARPGAAGPGNQQNAQRMRMMAMANFNRVKSRLVENLRQIGLRNYTDSAKLIIIENGNPDEVHASMEYDSKNWLHCMLTIPFEKIPINMSDPESGFSIGLETGFLEPQQGPGGQGGGMGRPGGGGGRPAGGGGRPAGGRAGRSSGPQGLAGGTPGGGSGGRLSPQQRQEMMEQREALSAKTKFWIKGITLAPSTTPSGN